MAAVAVSGAGENSVVWVAVFVSSDILKTGSKIMTRQSQEGGREIHFSHLERIGMYLISRELKVVPIIFDM